MAYLAYTRVSTMTQAEDGNGLAMQRQAIEEYARDHNIQISGWHEDAGISGAAVSDDDTCPLSMRHGLLDLLAAAQKGDTVIVYSRSRLWRSGEVCSIVRRLFRQRGLEVISTTEPSFSMTAKLSPTEALIDNILADLDEFSRAEIACKLAAGRRTKAKAGRKACGVAPFGYAWDGKDIAVNAAEADIVKRMFSMALNGSSLGTIAKELSEDGVTNRKGKAFSRQAIATIIHNPFYAGKIQHGDIEAKGEHEALVAPNIFGRVQKAIAK